MQSAVNPKTGEVLFLVNDQWVKPSQTAVNPKTGENAYLINNAWQVMPMPKPTGTDRTFGEALVTDPVSSLLSGVGTLLGSPGQLKQLVTGEKPSEEKPKGTIESLAQTLLPLGIDPSKMLDRFIPTTKTPTPESVVSSISSPFAGLQPIGEELEAFGKKQQSAGLKAAEKGREKAIQEAEGFLPEMGAAVGQTVKNPALLTSFIFEQIPNFVGTLGGGALTKEAAKAFFKNATEKTLGKVGVGGAVATGGAMQAGDIGSETYQTIYDRLVKEGNAPDKAHEVALEKGRMAAAQAGAISVTSSFIPGGRALERRFLTDAGKKAGFPGVVPAVGNVLGETVQEGTEEGGGKLVSNIQVADVFPDTDIMKGVGAATGLGALGGGMFGGIANAPSALSRTPQETTPPGGAVPPVSGPPTVVPPGASPAATATAVPLEAQLEETPAAVRLAELNRAMQEVDAAFQNPNLTAEDFSQLNALAGQIKTQIAKVQAGEEVTGVTPPTPPAPPSAPTEDAEEGALKRLTPAQAAIARLKPEFRQEYENLKLEHKQITAQLLDAANSGRTADPALNARQEEILKRVDELYSDKQYRKAAIEKLPNDPAIEKEALTLANELEKVGDNASADGLRRNLSNMGGYTDPKKLDYYKGKLLEAQQKVGKAAEMPKEKVSMANYMGLGYENDAKRVEEFLNKPTYYDKLKKEVQATQEVRDIFAKSNEYLQKITDRINELGYKAQGQEYDAPKEVQDLRTKLGEIAGSTNRLIKEDEGIIKGYKRGNWKNLPQQRQKSLNLLAKDFAEVDSLIGKKSEEEKPKTELQQVMEKEEKLESPTISKTSVIPHATVYVAPYKDGFVSSFQYYGGRKSQLSISTPLDLESVYPTRQEAIDVAAKEIRERAEVDKNKVALTWLDTVSTPAAPKKTQAEINRERQAEKKAAQKSAKEVTGTELKESESKSIPAQEIVQAGNKISNIRYAQDGKIAFTFNGQDFLIKEPSDVILVGTDQNLARKWIAKKYGFLLAPFATTKEAHIEGKKSEPVTSKTIEEAIDKAEVTVDSNKIKTAIKNQFDQAIKRAKIQTEKEWSSAKDLLPAEKFVTISVPGDGQFKVKNNVERLKELQTKMVNATTLKGPAVKGGPTSGSLEAFKGMVDDKDMENAIEYAKLKGLDPKTVKLTPAQRTTVDNYLKNPAEFERQTEEAGQMAEARQEALRADQEKRIAERLAAEEEREEEARFKAVIDTTIASTEAQLKRDIAAKKISTKDARRMVEVFPNYPEGTIKPYTIRLIEKRAGAEPSFKQLRKNVTEDGQLLDHPIFDELVNTDKYEMLDLRNPRTYVDKGGIPHRTFERNGVRMAFTTGEKLFQTTGKERQPPQTGIGDNKDVHFRALLVDPDVRRQGKATRALNTIRHIADRNELKIYLEPAEMEKNGITKAQLTDLYAKFQFKPTNEVGKIMLREPETYSVMMDRINAEMKAEGKESEYSKQVRQLADLKKQVAEMEAKKAAPQANIDDFVKDMPALQQGKAKKDLQADINYKGQITSRAELIKKLVNEGRVITEIKYKKPITKAQEQEKNQLSKKYIVGASNENLPGVKRLKELQDIAKNGNVTVERVLGTKELHLAQDQITKTGMDYAQYLIDKKEGTFYNNFDPDFTQTDFDHSVDDVRKEKIKEQAAASRKLTSVVKKIANMGSDIASQYELNRLAAIKRGLQDEIASLKQPKTLPEDILAKAAKERAEFQRTGGLDGLSPEAFAVLEALYKKQPYILNGLKLSVRRTERPGVTGSFEPMERLVTIYKKGISAIFGGGGKQQAKTMRHEIAHSLEQMMTPEVRQALVNAWANSLQKAIKKHEGDEVYQNYFDAVMDFIENPNNDTYQKATNRMPDYSMYQYISPSEFWAVNAEPLLNAQLGGAWARFTKAVKGLWEAIKSVFGFDNRYAVHREFNRIMSGDQQRITKDMLVNYLDQTGVSKKFINNIEEEQSLIDDLNLPEVPDHQTRSMKDMAIAGYRRMQDLGKEFGSNPGKTATKSLISASDAITKQRIENVYFAAGLDKRDQAKYNGQIRAADGFMAASIAIKNAIHSAHISTQVIIKGGIEYSQEFGQIVAKKTEQSMANVVKLEHAIKQKLGNKLGLQIVNGYFIAKRSRSIQNEFLNASAALQKAQDSNDFAQIAEAQSDYNSIKIAYGKVPKYFRQLNKDGKPMYSSIEDENGEIVDRIPILNDEAIDRAIGMEKLHPELKQMMENWTAVNQNMLDIMAFSGRISKKTAEKLKAIKDYVPWYRIMDDQESIHDGSLISNLPGGPRRFKAGETDRDIDNVVESMIHNVVMMTRGATKTYAINRVISEYGQRYEEGPKKGKLMVFPSEGRDAEGTRIASFIGGRRVITNIPDDLVADSVIGLIAAPFTFPLQEVLGAAANGFRRSITFTPWFQVKQLIIDAPTAAWVSGVRNPFKLWAGVFSGFVNALEITGDDPVVQILNNAGIGGFQSFHRSAKKEREIQLGLLKRSNYAAVLNAIDKVGDASDLAQRVSVYKRVLAEKGDPALALLQAADIIDFQKHGKGRLAQAMRTTVTFMQAYATQLDALAQASIGGNLKGKTREEAKKQFRKTGMLLASTTMMYVFMAAADDDYWELDDQTRLRNFYIPGSKKATGHHILIPMTTSAAFFFKAAPELLHNFIVSQGTKNEMDKRRTAKALGTVAVDALLGPSPVPTGAKPIAEIAFNYDFYKGTNVVPKGLEGLESAEQYNASTSNLGHAVSKLSGGALNPIQADHLMRGMGGSVAALGMYFSNLAFPDDRPAPELKQNPIIGNLVAPEVSRKNEELFYDLREKATNKYKTYQSMMENDRFDEADKFYEKNQGLIDVYEYVSSIDTDLKEINKEVRRLGKSSDKSLTPQGRTKDINELKKLKSEMLDNVTDFRKEAGF